ncbi:hypothetical protein ABN584_10575 [Gloeocapsa sp. BRSZ]
MPYREFFKQCTGFFPYPWQVYFSAWSSQSIAVVAAPTGAGKEFGAVIPWLYLHKMSIPTTARLVYALLRDRS